MTRMGWVVRIALAAVVALVEEHGPALAIRRRLRLEQRPLPDSSRDRNDRKSRGVMVSRISRLQSSSGSFLPVSSHQPSSTSWITGWS